MIDLAPARSPKPEPVHPGVTLGPEARQLLAALGAEASRLRLLERLPTTVGVERARQSIPLMAALLARLADELPVTPIAPASHDVAPGGRMSDLIPQHVGAIPDAMEDLIAARKLGEQP